MDVQMHLPSFVFREAKSVFSWGGKYGTETLHVAFLYQIKIRKDQFILKYLFLFLYLPHYLTGS